MTVVTKKIKVSVVGDTPEERSAGYKEIRRQADINRRLKNKMMTHLWTEYSLKDTMVNIQNKDITRITKKLEAVKKKHVTANTKATKAEKDGINNAVELRAKSNELMKEIDSLQKERDGIRNQAYKKAEEFLTEMTLGNKEAMRLYRMETGDEDVWSNTISSAIREVQAKFKEEIIDVLKGSKMLPTYKSGDVYVRSNKDISKTKIYQKGNDFLIKTLKAPPLKLNMDARRQNGRELRKTIQKCIDGEYGFLDSKLKFYDNDLFLLATIEIPEKKNYLDPNTIVGVDLGMAIPAYCGLNNDEYTRLSIGTAKDFLHIRTQMQSRRRALQKSMTLVKGGKGRNKKLQKLDKLKESERNFAKTYNHMVSKRIIEFALKNKAGQINVEDLHFDNKEDTNNRMLRNWSYFELQSMIEYKANKEGIIYNKVNPKYTSQTCSFCGHFEENQRLSQDTFCCKNPKCKKGKGNNHRGINADWNASRNIAKDINQEKLSTIDL